MQAFLRSIGTRRSHEERRSQADDPERLVRRGNPRAFIASLALVAVFWGGVLPWVGRLPAVRARIQRQEQAGIDPSAMFYTELGDISGIHLRREGHSWCVDEFTLGK